VWIGAADSNQSFTAIELPRIRHMRAEMQTAVLPGASRFAANQRGDVRYRVERPAMIRVDGAKGYLVTILDVSAGGLRVSCPTGFQAGTGVEICLPRLQLRGEIRYARKLDGGGGFHLGIQIATGTESELLLRLRAS
jgi:hypothetical protein